MIVILHLVGVFGLTSERWSALFMRLSPITLLITAALVLLFQPKWGLQLFLFFSACLLVGFGIEWLGVHTAVLFGGPYAYGSNLGPQVGQVPLIMGLLWFLLTFSAGTIVHWLSGHTRLLAWRISRAALGALLMVLLDFPMEYLAEPLGYWSWDLPLSGVLMCGAAPTLNYFTWFVVSFLLLLLYDRTQLSARRNPVAAVVLPVQFVFFLTLHIIYALT